MPTRSYFYLLFFAGVIIVIGLVLYANGRDMVPAEDDNASTTQQSVQSYESAVHGFSLIYPAELVVQEHAPDHILFMNAAEKNVAQAQVHTITAASGQTLPEAAAAKLREECASFMPSERFTCTGIRAAAPISNEQGTSGYRIVLIGERTDTATQATTSVDTNPMFIFPIDSSATMSKVLLIRSATLSADMVVAAVVETIAQSVKVTTTEPNEDPIAEYIRNNISTLSPEKESMGGTFYVTALQANGNTGTVSYEDGHNAYTADFTYSIDESGVTVNSFSIR